MFETDASHTRMLICSLDFKQKLLPPSFSLLSSLPMCCSTLPRVESARVLFDLPHDKMEKAPRVFPEQSSQEVLFLSNAGTHVQPNRIESEHSPEKALRLMLLGKDAADYHRQNQRNVGAAPPSTVRSGMDGPWNPPK